MVKSEVKTVISISGILLGLCLLLALSSPTSAEVASANASVTVSSACTFSSTLDTPHTASVPSGTNQPDIGVTTFNVICNDSEGFSIYAVGYSNNEYGNNNLIATVGGELSPTYNIATGTATSGSTGNWSMKLAPVSGTSPSIIQNSYDSYQAVPDTYTKIATYPSATNSTTGASFTSTYQTYISGTQPAGTYAGKVKYTFVHPASETPLEPKDATPRCISYWPNASGVVDAMGDQCSFSNNASADLWASNFQREGYGFAGWSTTYDYSDPDGFYGPNETITTPSDMTTKGLSLYAYWVKSVGSLQDWNYCSAMNIGDVTALTDKRDNNTYAIAKLADGNCWMIENLRLDNQYTTGDINKSLAQGYNSSFIGLADPETANFNDSTTANSLYSTDGSTTATISGSNQAYRFPRYNNQNTSSPATNMTAWGKNANTYSVGNWYTWSAAVADTRYYTSGSRTATSICPSGWHLPTGNTGGEFRSLDSAMGGTGAYQSTTEASLRWRKYPNNFIYSGNIYGSSLNNRGSRGFYWSSSVSTGGGSYCLSLGSSDVKPGSSNSNNGGFAVRCLAGS